MLTTNPSRTSGTTKPTLREPKLLVFDVETLPIGASVWNLFDQNVGLNQINDDWAMLSYAAKYLGKRTMYYADTRHAVGGIRDDRDIVAQLTALLDECDIVVGQNVKKFDLRKLRARAVMHGLKPFREPKVIDTLMMAKSVGAFTSNKLEYLASNLTDAPKSKHAKFPGFELWAGIMRDEDGAWDEMKKYNIQDVKATEKLYLALRPWAPRLPNLAQFYDDELMRCPRCGSTTLNEFGTTVSNVSEYTQYVCTNCGGYSRSRFTINSKQKRKALLAT